MSNPNKLTTNKNTLTKRVLGAMGGLGLIGAGFLAGDRMHNEAPVSQNNDPTPTEVSTLAPTPEETLEMAGIRIADTTPTPNVEETLPATKTPTPIVFTGSSETTPSPTSTDEAEMTPIVFTGNAQDSPSIEFTGDGPVPTSVVEFEGQSSDQAEIVFTNEEVIAPATIENAQPTIAPVVSDTFETVAVATDEPNADTIEPDAIVADEPTPTETGSDVIIEPEHSENLTEVRVQVYAGEDVSQVLAEILQQAGYTDISQEQVAATAKELMNSSTISPEGVFEGNIVVIYDEESGTYKVATTGEGSLTPSAAEFIQTEVAPERP